MDITKYAHARGIEIYEKIFQVGRDLGNPTSQQAMHIPIYRDFRQSLEACWAVGRGTVVIDTTTNLYALNMMAHHGKLSQIPPYLYGIMYAELEDMLNIQAYNSGMSAVYIDKMGPVFEGKGAMERKGYRNIPFLVQMNIEMTREDFPGTPEVPGIQVATPPGTMFGIWIKDSSHTALLNNKHFQDLPGTLPENSRTSMEYLMRIIYDREPIP